MRPEEEIQMTKTNCNLIHFEESYFSKSREAFICSQAKSSQGYTSVGQAVSDDSNCGSGSKPPMPGILKISQCLKMQTCTSKTDYNNLVASLGISSPLKSWYVTRRKGGEKWYTHAYPFWILNWFLGPTWHSPLHSLARGWTIIRGGQ